MKYSSSKPTSQIKIPMSYDKRLKCEFSNVEFQPDIPAYTMVDSGRLDSVDS